MHQLHHSEQLQYDAPNVVQYNGFIATVQPNQQFSITLHSTFKDTHSVLWIVHCGAQWSEGGGTGC